MFVGRGTRGSSLGGVGHGFLLGPASCRYCGQFGKLPVRVGGSAPDWKRGRSQEAAWICRRQSSLLGRLIFFVVEAFVEPELLMGKFVSKILVSFEPT